MQTARGLVLIAATMTTGVTAGAFLLYAHTVMPGLARTDDRTFVGAFAQLDRAIINPWFMVGGFLGGPVLVVVAVLLGLGRPALPWIAAALLLSLVAVVVTLAVHVPLNNAIKAAGPARSQPDPAAVRARFDEARWATWNLLRVVVSLSAFGCLCRALLVDGRAIG